MLNKQVIAHRTGFRELNGNELAMIGGGYYDEDPIDDVVQGSFEQDNSAYLDSIGIYSYDDGEGNQIVVIGSGGGSSGPNFDPGSQASSVSAQTFSGEDLLDPTSELNYILDQLFNSELYPNVFDFDGDGQGDFIVVTAQEIHTVTDSDQTEGDGDGSFYGAFVFTPGTGGGVGLSEGGNTGLWTIGSGGTLEFGYSASDEEAASRADNSGLQVQTGPWSILKGASWVPLAGGVNFDSDPLVIGFQLNVGVQLSIAETHAYDGDGSDETAPEAPSSQPGEETHAY